LAKSPAIDRAELEALYRAYGPLVRRRARGLLGDDLEAQDALQEVFVRVIGAMGEFRRQSQPSTWLYRITTNLCLNRIRDGRRRREHLNRLGEESLTRQQQPGGNLPPETRATLRRILGDIEPELAEIAIYYYVDEMDQVEIATILGVSRRTIGYRLDRFRSEAQRVLGERGVAARMGGGVPKGASDAGTPPAKTAKTTKTGETG
jgi:RNA polymerase sigma-70 factor (ECF subfamily)